MTAATFSTVRWPALLDNMTLTSLQFPVATVARAASRSFSQVLLEIYDVDAIIFPFVEVLSHLEVKVGAT